MTYLNRALAVDSLPYQAGLYLIGRKCLDQADVPTRYEILRGLYDSNGVYDTVGRAMAEQGLWSATLKALANPTHAVVEFYASKLLAGLGEDAIVAGKAAIVGPIARFWQWSNFTNRRAFLGRQAARDGDAFWKIVRVVDAAGAYRRVYLEPLDPAEVVAFDRDDRAYLTWLRLDQPKTRRLANGTDQPYVHIEVWDKAAGTYRRWEVDSVHAVEDDLSRLGPPAATVALADWGIDFIPIVWVPFREVGDERGQAAVWPNIEKLVNLDLIVTALHQTYFAYDRPTFALESAGRDPSGRVIPPPQVAGGATTGDQTTLTLGREKLYRLPAGWTLRDVIPDLNYEAGVRLIEQYWALVERTQPELAYARISEQGGDLSGRAIRFMLSGAIDAATEARANLEAGLVRADQMALTLMIGGGLAEASLGTFEAGDFEHGFAEREIVPTDELSDAQTELAKAQAYAAWRQAGLPDAEALLRAGYTEERAAELVTMQAEAAERALVTDTEQ